jgi:hypothetical protein
VSEKQAQKLDVKAYTQWSPYLEKCCLLLSANESYARAAVDIQVLTGMAISHSTQQRLVHRQSFDLPQVAQAVDAKFHELRQVILTQLRQVILTKFGTEFSPNFGR